MKIAPQHSIADGFSYFEPLNCQTSVVIFTMHPLTLTSKEIETLQTKQVPINTLIKQALALSSH